VAPAKKYLVIGDEVFSPTDGQVHYVSAMHLVKLYGVPLAECVLWNPRPHGDDLREVEPVDVKGLIVLRPRADGNYRSNGGTT
jgi:hypothetical protein